MPVQVSYPGVYIQEIPSGSNTITGVSTSVAAFVDIFRRGPLNQPVRIFSFGDFQRTFGGLYPRSDASYAINQFFLNGGSSAWVVRISGGATQAQIDLEAGSPPSPAITVSARGHGFWGNNLQVAVDYDTRDTDDLNLFNLVVREVTTGRDGKPQVSNSEVHRNLSIDRDDPRYAIDAVNSESELVQLTAILDGGNVRRPNQSDNDVNDPAIVTNVAGDTYPAPFTALANGKNSENIDPNEIIGSEAEQTGMYALNKLPPDIFNILCLPAVAKLDESEAGDHGNFNAVISAANAYCEQKRAFLIVDIPPYVDTPEKMLIWKANIGNNLASPNNAVYFPRLEIPDSLQNNRPRNVGSSGTMAGVYARIDTDRGIWKAPAGVNTGLRGANVAVKVDDNRNGLLNLRGVNVLRSFPVFGTVSWGARTLEGADARDSEWKYIPVRRLALYIEESLFQGLKWAVFEPNDEPLWRRITQAVDAFMGDLHSQGAFQGSAASSAYFVECNSSTTTQFDIDRGIVNILVGFAPLKPAEFVILSIQQMAGQSSA